MTSRHVTRRIALAAMLIVVFTSTAGAQQAPRTWPSDVVFHTTSYEPASLLEAASSQVAHSPAAPGPRNAVTQMVTLSGTPTLAPPITLPAALLQDTRSRRWEGAAVGFVAGAVITYFVLHSGGSTSLCDRDANQDAIDEQYCVGLTVLGGVAGGAAGYAIGGRIRR